MAKQSLSSKANKVAVQEKEDQTLGAIIGDIGEVIGSYDVASKFDQDTVIDAVSEFLRSAMRHGLTCDKESPKGDMLKAPSKNNPGELWTILVLSINEPRLANGLPELTKGTRDNYLSRIRAFVRDRGVNELDLFGNIAAQKAKDALLAAKKQAAEQAAEVIAAAQAPAKDTETNLPSEEVHNTDKPAAVNARGLIALRDFLVAFQVQNDEPEVSDEMDMILNMADDLLKIVKNTIGAKQGKAKAKK